MNDQNPGPADEPPLHRACAHCRSQKIRCLPEVGNPETCQRCARAGRPCLFAAVRKRKQRMRTDTRVAELERQMRAMRAMLNDTQQGGSKSHNKPVTREVGGNLNKVNIITTPPKSSNDLINLREDGTTADLEQRDRIRQIGAWSQSRSRQPKGADVVDRGLLSMETAKHLFNAYTTDLFPHYPMVAVPADVTPDEMRVSKPTLFLAIIAAAAGIFESDLSAALDREVLQDYATRSLIQSEKSLELVQALLISASWYRPPNKFEQLKYYEYVHMAAAMAMDIGIGARAIHHRNDEGTTDPQEYPWVEALCADPTALGTNSILTMAPRSELSPPGTATVESRRTFLACYVICCGVSLILNRPNMLRVSSYIRECAEVLEHAVNTSTADRRLVGSAKLFFIADDISTTFSYDDHGAMASIADLRTQLILKDFKKRLDGWRNSVPEGGMDGSLEISYYTARLYLHEIALHVDHSPDDFKAPYQMSTIIPPKGEDIPTAVLADAVAELISSSHSVLDAFLAMDVQSLRSLPGNGYVRVCFAAFVLAKLCLSASDPRSRLGHLLDLKVIEMESYIDRAIMHVRHVIGSQKVRIPVIFLALLIRLREWCLHLETVETPESDRTTAYPSTKDVRVAEYLPSPDMQALDGPRFTEHHSSSENSPRTFPPSKAAPLQSSTNEATFTQGVNDAPTNRTPVSSSDDSMSNKNAKPSWAASACSADMPPDVISSGFVSITADEVYSTGNALDGMVLDKDFYSLLGEVGGSFPDAEFSGLDDWASLPDVNMWETPQGSQMFRYHAGAQPE